VSKIYTKEEIAVLTGVGLGVLILGIGIAYLIWVGIAWLFAITFGWTYNIWLGGLVGLISVQILKSIFKKKE